MLSASSGLFTNFTPGASDSSSSLKPFIRSCAHGWSTAPVVSIALSSLTPLASKKSATACAACRPSASQSVWNVPKRFEPSTSVFVVNVGMPASTAWLRTGAKAGTPPDSTTRQSTAFVASCERIWFICSFAFACGGPISEPSRSSPYFASASSIPRLKPYSNSGE